MIDEPDLEYKMIPTAATLMANNIDCKDEKILWESAPVIVAEASRNRSLSLSDADEGVYYEYKKSVSSTALNFSDLKRQLEVFLQILIEVSFYYLFLYFFQYIQGGVKVETNEFKI